MRITSVPTLGSLAKTHSAGARVQEGRDRIDGLIPYHSGAVIPTANVTPQNSGTVEV